MYCRYSANSTLKPLKGLRCSPERKPSTIVLAFSSSVPRRAMTAGSRNAGRSTGPLRTARVAPRRPRYIPLFGTGTASEQPIDDRVRRDALGFGVEVRHDPVAQNRLGERLDVLDRDVIAAVHQGARLRAAHQRLRRAEAGAPLHPLLDELRRARPSRPRRIDEPDDVARDLVGNRHLPDDLLKLQDVGAGQHPRPASAARLRSSASPRAPHRPGSDR